MASTVVFPMLDGVLVMELCPRQAQVLTGLLFTRKGSVNNKYGKGDECLHEEPEATAGGRESADPGDLPWGVASGKTSLRSEG